MKQGWKQAKMPIFCHLARGGEADFCGLCFGEREKRGEANAT